MTFAQERQVKLVELYCNLHPLETIVSKTRNFLRECVRYAGATHVSECIESRLLVDMTSIKYLQNDVLYRTTRDYDISKHWIQREYFAPDYSSR